MHHGLSETILEGLGSKFRSNFWMRLMGRSGIQLNMSTSGHSCIDGESEIMDWMREIYFQWYCPYHYND